MAEFLSFTFSDFDPVVKGVYSHRFVKFVNEETGKLFSFQERVDRLVCCCKTILKEIEMSGEVIEEFVIGKTFSELSEPKGIESRWHDYSKNGFHGLVAIACVSEEDVRGSSKYGEECREEYCLALELMLIIRFMHDERDQDMRLSNRSFHPGKTWTLSHKYGIVYIAYRLKENE